MNGILLLNKPSDISSHQVLQKVKQLMGASKAGHTGALDPIATGVLPLCFGEATKFAQFGLDSVKGYRVKAKLGIATETGDRTGDICSQKPIPQDFTKAIFQSVLDKFIGIQHQTPSLYSAIKYKGKPLYKYARKGRDVPRTTRGICIGSIDIIEWPNSHGEFTLEVLCSKGTYIRTFIEDVGFKIGCGAHVLELHRTRAGFFTDELAIDYESIQPGKMHNHMIPISCFLTGLNWQLVNTPAADALLAHGHAFPQKETVNIDHLKKDLPEFVRNAYDLPPVLKSFVYKQAQKIIEPLPHHIEKEAPPQIPLVLFSPKTPLNKGLYLEENINALSLNDVYLRGLAFPALDTFQPRRMIQNNQIVI